MGWEHAEPEEPTERIIIDGNSGPGMSVFVTPSELRRYQEYMALFAPREDASSADGVSEGDDPAELD